MTTKRSKFLCTTKQTESILRDLSGLVDWFSSWMGINVQGF